MKALNHLLLSLFLCVLPFCAEASHIFGGDFSMQAVAGSPGRYKITLTAYIDNINASTGARNRMANSQLVAIYRKADNARMTTLLLSPEPTQTFAPSACGENSSSVQTAKYSYSSEITLNPATYNSPRGYYLVFQDCCRNYSIVNAVSTQSSSTGMAFYLEFPPLQDASGNYFQNSSPQFSFADGQIICINQQTEIDFSATDADGDQLVYELVTPYSSTTGNTSSTTTAPAAIGTVGGTYPYISWRGGYGVNNMIPGNPPLSINRTTGVLSITATEKGLAYVIAVEVKEFRGGKQIGLVKREYQFLVTECKPAPPKPVVFKENAPAVERTNGVKFIDFCEEGFVNIETRKDSSINYQWYKDGLEIPDAVGYKLEIRKAGIYKVKMFYPGGCSQKSESETTTVVEKPGEKVLITPSVPLPACANVAKNLSLSVNKTGANYVYLWKLNGDSLKKELTNTIKPTKNGKYQVVVTNKVSTCSYDPSLDVDVKPLPTAKITNTKGLFKICEGDTLSLQAAKGQDYTFAWYLNAKALNVNVDNLSPKQSGRYHYLVTDGNKCSKYSDTLSITVSPVPNVTLDSVMAFCGASLKKITLSANPLGGVFAGRGIASSSLGIFDPLLAGFGTHKVTYTYTNEYQCSSTATRYMSIAQTPTLKLGNDKSITKGDTISLKAVASNGVSIIEWNPPTGLDNPRSLTPVASPSTTTRYVVKVVYPNGCAAEGDITVNVYPGLKVPTGFTPNGDGLNDVWEIGGITDLPECEVEIYDRWGVKVYYSKGYDVPFDGQQQGRTLPFATYYYVIRPHNGGEYFKGTLTLLR